MTIAYVESISTIANRYDIEHAHPGSVRSWMELFVTDILQNFALYRHAFEDALKDKYSSS